MKKLRKSFAEACACNCVTQVKSTFFSSRYISYMIASCFMHTSWLECVHVFGDGKADDI
jgi:hypothetical protein